MAKGNGNFGKTFCPKCGATATWAGFGQERFRAISAHRNPLSNDPKIVQRRNRARAISAQNQG
jgi:hypothetical protein